MARTKLRFFTEKEYEKAGFLDRADMRRTDAHLSTPGIDEMNWAQLSDEFGDVWHRVKEICINKESPKWSYCTIFANNRLQGMVYLTHFRKFAKDLPEDARVIIETDSYKSKGELI